MYITYLSAIIAFADTKSLPWFQFHVYIHQQRSRGTSSSPKSESPLRSRKGIDFENRESRKRAFEFNIYRLIYKVVYKNIQTPQNRAQNSHHDSLIHTYKRYKVYHSLLHPLNRDNA